MLNFKKSQKIVCSYGLQLRKRTGLNLDKDQGMTLTVAVNI